MARLLETDTSTNVNVSSATVIGAYTATAVRLVHVRVLVAQVAGGGDYIIYATLTKGGTEYRIIPITTATAASALYSIAFVSVPIPMDVGDVLTVYLDGLAGDTTTPDVQVDYYIKDYVRPTTADRTLDISAAGEVGLDFDNVKVAASPVTLTNVTIPTVSTLTGHTPQTGDSFARIGAAGAGLTALGDARLAYLTGSVALEATLTAMKGAGWSAETLKAIYDQILLRLLTSGYTAPPNVGAIADAVWDEASGGHVAAGTMGKALQDAGTTTPTQIRDTVWGNTNGDRGLTQTGVQAAAAIDGGSIAIIASVGFTATISGLTISPTWTKAILTLKKDTTLSESQASAQIIVSNPGALTDGLKYINGASATAAQGSLTVNQVAGTVGIAIKDEATALLEAEGGTWDLKFLDSAAESTRPTSGTYTVSIPETLTIA